MHNVANRNWRKCQSFVTQRRFQLVCASQRWLLLCLTLITREAGFTSFCTLLRHLSSSRDRLHSATFMQAAFGNSRAHWLFLC